MPHTQYNRLGSHSVRHTHTYTFSARATHTHTEMNGTTVDTMISTGMNPI